MLLLASAQQSVMATIAPGGIEGRLQQVVRLAREEEEQARMRGQLPPR
jgi:hypothetical protein